MKTAKQFCLISSTCLLHFFSEHTFAAESSAQSLLSPSVAIVVPNAQLGPFRHGTKCIGYYADNRLVDIELVGKPSSKEYVTTKSLIHAGVDLIAEMGSEIYPIVDGTVDDVISSEKDPNFGTLGYMVLIEHKKQTASPGTYSIYLHLKEKPSVGTGDSVLAGKTALGRVGATGAAFGPHLHIEVRQFSGRFNEKWKNIYGIERPQSEATFDEAYFSKNWTDPLRFAVPNPASPTQAAANPAKGPVEDINSPWGIIDKALSAMGGKEALANQKGLYSKSQGNVLGSNPQAYTCESFAQWPAQLRNQMEITQKNGRVDKGVVVLNGIVGWQFFGSRLTELASGTATEIREELYAGNLLFLLASNDRNLYRLTLVDDKTLNGRTLRGVLVSRQGYPDVKLFFDKTSWLLARREQTVSGGKKISQVVEYSNFKEFGRFALATKIDVLRENAKYAEIQIEDASFSSEFDSSLFARESTSWVDPSKYLTKQTLTLTANISGTVEKAATELSNNPQTTSKTEKVWLRSELERIVQDRSKKEIKEILGPPQESDAECWYHVVLLNNLDTEKVEKSVLTLHFNFLDKVFRSNIRPLPSDSH